VLGAELLEDILKLIKSRRSVRNFRTGSPSDEFIDAVLSAGAWAPSGLNNQPWAFAVVRDENRKSAIAELTKYGRIVREAPVLIAVFLDNGKSYDRTKDCQAVGACIQNMLLYIHASGLGAVWLGEILKNKDAVAAELNAPEGHELMAVVALGTPAGEAAHEGKRRPVYESIIYRDSKK